MLLVVLLMVLSVLFGGFQKGAKVNGLGSLCSFCTTAPVTTAHWWAPGRSTETGPYRSVTRCAIVRGVSVIDDLGAEQERLEGILSGLDEAQWVASSGAAGWTIADVVLHLAQSEESVVATVSAGNP